jgi:hypothetical protein
VQQQEQQHEADGELIALGESTHWLLVPHLVLRECQGELRI